MKKLSSIISDKRIIFGGNDHIQGRRRMGQRVHVPFTFKSVLNKCSNLTISPYFGVKTQISQNFLGSPTYLYWHVVIKLRELKILRLSFFYIPTMMTLLWNAKLTETQIFIEIESSLIELKSSLIEPKSYFN